MTTSSPTWRRCVNVAAISTIVLALAVAAVAQISMAPNLIGKQLLARPNPAEDPNFPRRFWKSHDCRVGRQCHMD